MKCADIQKSRAAGRIYCVIGLAGLTGILVSALVALPASAGPETPASSNPSDDIRRLREQLAEQTKRIDHLYDALGPELPEMEARAAELKKQRAEDAVLAMKEVFRSKDEAFNSKLMFVPATRRLAVAQADGSVKLLRLPEGEVEATLDGLGDAAQCLAASADGKKIFAGTKKGLLLAWQDGSNNARKVFDWQGWPVTALAVGPDGSRLACACNGKYGSNREWIKPENSLLMIETASGKELWAGKVGRGDFQAVAFAGDGKTVAVVRDGVVALLDAGTGRTLRELAQKDHPSGPLSTALSRDGKWCAVGYAPYNIGLWNADAGKCQRLLPAHKNWVVALAFSPDGSLLASSSGDTTASVWEIETGREIGRLRFGDGPAYVYSVSISDDNRWVAAGRSGEFVALELPDKSYENK